MTYRCFCCDRRPSGGVCTCVISARRRCLMCLSHCDCPERHARLCGVDAELNTEDGPFADLAGRNDEPKKP